MVVGLTAEHAFLEWIGEVLRSLDQILEQLIMVVAEAYAIDFNIFHAWVFLLNLVNQRDLNVLAE